MSNLVNHAKSELELLIIDGDEEQKEVNKDILQIVEIFSKQGHSGFSAHYTIGMLRRVLSYLPLQALTGEPEEWNEVGNETYQNNRCSSVFKQGINGQAYWLDGKVFSDDGGKTWFTNNKSRINVTFPFHVPVESKRVILRTRSALYKFRTFFKNLTDRRASID